MKANRNLNQEIEKTLEAYSNAETPTLNPYFTSKLKARMEAEMATKPAFKLSLSMKLAVGALFLLINSVTIFNYTQSQNKSYENQAISALETQYSVEATDVYAYNWE
jgi:hypothetical protein